MIKRISDFILDSTKTPPMGETSFFEKVLTKTLEAIFGSGSDAAER